MIIDVGSHNRSVPDFAIPSQGRASWNIQIDSQPTVRIRLSWNLVGWVLDIRPHNLAEPHFLIFSHEVLGVAPLAIFKSIHSLPFLSDWAETLQDDTRYQSPQSLGGGFSAFLQGALLRRASRNFEIDSQPTVFIRLSWHLVGWY